MPGGFRSDQPGGEPPTGWKLSANDGDFRAATAGRGLPAHTEMIVSACFLLYFIFIELHIMLYDLSMKEHILYMI